MSEIEKMYRNVLGYVCNMPDIDCFHECEKCDSYITFTAEKQLSLTKFLLERGLECNTCKTGKDVKYVFYIGYEHSSGDFKEFTEALAGIINDLWQSLTKEEKQQIKEVLE